MTLPVRQVLHDLSDRCMHLFMLQRGLNTGTLVLLREILNAHRDGKLAQVAVPATRTQRYVERIAADRKLVDEIWHEKLTLCDIARRCSLNRSKLARGFRLLYRCTVTEALLERRLGVPPNSFRSRLAV